MPLVKKMLSYLLLIGSVLLIGSTLLSLAYNSTLRYLKVLNFPKLLTSLSLLGCLLLVILTFRSHQKRSLALLVGLIVAIAIQSYILYPYTPLTSRRVASVEDNIVDSKAQFSVLVANVLMTNRASDKLLQVIRDKEPGVCAGDGGWYVVGQQT